MDLLIGASDFWPAFERDVKAARSSVVLQTISLPEDDGCRRLVHALLESTAPSRRLIVSGIDVPADVKGALVRAGVKVRFTDTSSARQREPSRNHKKTVVIDGVLAYFGGIDFCCGEFASVIVRAESSRVAAALERDFQAGWQGRPTGVYVRDDGLELHTLDGPSNRAAFDMLFTRIALAQRSILVHSRNLTLPFSEHLHRAADRGVRVDVLAPERTGSKAILIDDSCLVFGSSSFDQLSYRVHQDVLAYVTDTVLVRQFQDRVLGPAWASAAAS